MTNYLHKEHIVLGDESRMQETIDGWWRHVNAVVYRRHQELFTGCLCDIGCNIGMMTLLAATDPRVECVLGLDVQPAALAAACRYRDFLHLQSKVEYRVVDFTKPCPEIADASFDCVMSFHTLEHILVADLVPFLANVHRILKPDGVVFVSIPYKTAHNSPEHESWFDENSLRNLFTQNGFESVVIEVDDGAILTGIFKKEKHSEPPVLS